MSEFLSAAFSLPTAAFTWLLMPITLYWIVAIFGVFNIDWMDGMEGAVEGAGGGGLLKVLPTVYTTRSPKVLLMSRPASKAPTARLKLTVVASSRMPDLATFHVQSLGA